MDKKPFTPKLAGGPPKKNSIKNAGFIILLVLFGLIIYASYNNKPKLQEVPLSSVIQQANEGKIKKITIIGNEKLEITKQGEDKPSQRSVKETYSSIFDQGLNKDAKVEINPKEASN